MDTRIRKGSTDGGWLCRALATSASWFRESTAVFSRRVPPSWPWLWWWGFWCCLRPRRIITFRAERGGLGLCQGRLWGLIGSQVPGYGFIPVTAEGARALVGKPFATSEEALKALRPIVEQAAREGVAAVAAKEKELAQAYKTVLPNLQGAKLLGVPGYDARVEALEKWMAVVTGSAKAVPAH